MNDKLMIKSITGRCLAVRTLSAARAISRRYDTALRPVGLTITQFTLLAAIAQTRPNSISEIAERLSMERITDKGLSLLREAYPLWEKAQLETEALLGDEIDETNRFLNLLRNGPLS
jgi:DNA-binding MarR family transcriptional regulator